MIFKLKAARKEDEDAILKAFDILDFISRLYLASYHHGRTDGALKVVLQKLCGALGEGKLF